MSARRPYLLLVLAFGICLTATAQQRMRYSQYLLNSFMINPAVGGAERFGDLRAGYSHQWAGFKGAPKGLSISYNQSLQGQKASLPPVQHTERTTSLPVPGREQLAPTRAKDTLGITPIISLRPDPAFHLGVGGTIFSEFTGPLAISGIGGAVSTHIRIERKLRLSVGAGLEMLNYRIDPTRIDLVNDNDIAIAGSVTNLMLPSLNAGFALYSESFFITGATRQVLQNRIQLNLLNPYISTLDLHYVLQAGYRFRLNEDLNLLPSVVFRYVEPAPPSFDFNLQASYRNQFFAGLSYRHQDALVAMLGLTLNKTVLVQYAYDFTTSNIRRYSAGTHSIVLGMKLGQLKHQERRFFW